MLMGRDSSPGKTRTAQRTAGGGAECEWRLPSGEDLISFALNVGLAAGPLAEPIVGAGPAERWPAARTSRRSRGRRS